MDVDFSYIITEKRCRCKRAVPQAAAAHLARPGGGVDKPVAPQIHGHMPGKIQQIPRLAGLPGDLPDPVAGNQPGIAVDGKPLEQVGGMAQATAIHPCWGTAAPPIGAIQIGQGPVHQFGPQLGFLYCLGLGQRGQMGFLNVPCSRPWQGDADPAPVFPPGPHPAAPGQGQQDLGLMLGGCQHVRPGGQHHPGFPLGLLPDIPGFQIAFISITRPYPQPAILQLIQHLHPLAEPDLVIPFRFRAGFTIQGRIGRNDL